FTIYPLLMRRSGKILAKTILAPRGMLQDGAMGFKKFKKILFLRALNLLGIPNYIHAHATDAQERNDIYKYLPTINTVSVISNFSSIIQALPNSIVKEKGELRCVYISRIT